MYFIVQVEVNPGKSAANQPNCHPASAVYRFQLTLRAQPIAIGRGNGRMDMDIGCKVAINLLESATAIYVELAACVFEGNAL